MNRKKRSINGGPVSAYVEYLAVIDSTIYNDLTMFLGILNQLATQNTILQNIRIYYAYIINGVIIS
jgi:hypothetical protein